MVKLNLEKAYNKVISKFLLMTLSSFIFPPLTIKLIRLCLTISMLEMLWNGKCTGSFIPGRGLH